jgi:ribosomal protein S18 acetylase RimI-like enzyme
LNYDPSGAMRIVEVERDPWLAATRELLLEYAASLDFRECFQDFDRELIRLPGAYAPPHGRLLLLLDGEHAAGCVACRPLGHDVAEMKRLYVRAGWRGRGLGRALAEEILVRARQVGYRTMRLETLPSMTAAVGLYRTLGFRPIAPYHAGPSGRSGSVAGGTCFERALGARGQV